MATDTAIEWADHTASPWHGCSEVHAGCDNCYARELSKRNPVTLGTWGPDGIRVKSKSFIRNLRLWNKQAAASGRIDSVFPSLCDPFEDRPELEPWRREMFEVIDQCANLRLLLLTKRPENVRKMWPWIREVGTHRIIGSHRLNVFLLTSVSDQTTSERMVPELLACRDLVPVLGLSAEPLLGPIDLAVPWEGEPTLPTMQVDWVIVGGESGPRARPCDIGWIRSIRDQCQAADVPVFVKQLGSRPVSNEPVLPDWPDYVYWQADDDGLAFRCYGLNDSKGGDWNEWPADLRVREF